MATDYLRVSVTDGCNLQCIYCNPLGHGRRGGDDRVLSFDEIHRIVALCVSHGVRRVRLTGGEPLMRAGIADLVRRLAAIDGIDDLSLTTNGVLLGPMATDLMHAGLGRVNIT